MVPRPDREWLCFSINRIQGYNGSAICSVYKGMELWEDWVVTKLLHKPDVWELQFVSTFSWWPCLCSCFPNMTAFFLLMKYRAVLLYWRWSNASSFFECNFFKQPLVTYIVNIISHLPLFALMFLEHQLHIFCNHLKISISSYIVNRLETMKMYLRINVYHVHTIKIWILKQPNYLGDKRDGIGRAQVDRFEVM